MAGATVIDRLVVTLGLDPKQFTKGQKEAAAATLETDKAVKRSGQSIGSELTKMTAKWLTVAAAIKAVQFAVKTIDDVATRTRRLGIDAGNFNIAANNLRNFENAVEMLGGSGEEARKTIQGLTKDVFNLAYNGQVSDSLVMLTRLGVGFQTATGDARDFKDIVLDTADAIARAQDQGMSRANAFQYLQQAGFDQGTAQLILTGRSGVEAGLAEQGKRRQVSGQDYQNADAIARAKTDKEQTLENGKIMTMNAVGGVQQTINEMIAHPSEALDKLGDAASHAGTALENWAIQASGMTRGMRNNNPGNIRAVGNQRRDREGFRVFDSMEEGVKAADSQLQRYAKRGINTIDSIVNTWAPSKDKNNVPAYIKDIVKDTGIDANAPLNPSSYNAVMAAMFKHESGNKAPTEGTIDDILGVRTDDSLIDQMTGGGADPSPNARAGAGGNTTNVDIDSVTVNTQATNAEQMATDMNGALQRKLFASHAEQGMQ